MMFVMLVAGIGLILAGLLAIAYGIGVQLSTGNTLIIAGMIGVCTGMIMLGFWTTVRELKNIARRLGSGVPEARGGWGAAGLPVAATRIQPPVAASWTLSAGGSGPFSSPAVPDPSLQRHSRRRGRTKLSCGRIRFRNRCTPNRHRRRNRSAICCFHRRREKSASVLRRGPARCYRRTCCRRTFASGRPPCRRSKRPNRRRHRSTMPGRERNAQSPMKCRCRGAAAGCPRRSQKPTADRRTAMISPR